jgi:hypothetical protein
VKQLEGNPVQKPQNKQPEDVSSKRYKVVAVSRGIKLTYEVSWYAAMTPSEATRLAAHRASTVAVISGFPWDPFNVLLILCPI